MAYKFGITPYTPHTSKKVEKAGWSDTYLTPIPLIKALGPFDLDPACPPEMPWRTARKMYHFPKQDGLELPWRGRVWLNPPFSKMKAFAQKMIEHGSGVILLNGRATETRASQLCFEASSAVLLMSKRIRFCDRRGRELGAWFPSILVGFGSLDRDRLYDLSVLERDEFGGTVFKRL